jgi:CDP-diacylglycerol---glycerol-3-phosphate 3-phosphatidyltransferase
MATTNLTGLTGYLSAAEVIAERALRAKDNLLGHLAEPMIPIPARRRLVRNWIKRTVATISRPWSEKIDLWIELDIITTPNLLSASRAVAGPLFIIFYAHDVGLAGYLALVVWAVVSDLFDGILARKMGQVTELGGAIDAGCDKIFAACMAISLLPSLWPLNILAFFVLDGTLATLAIILYQAKKRGAYQGNAQVKANWLGKTKFCLQGITAILILLGLTDEGNYALIAANLFAFGSILRHLSPRQN